ncbi:MAG TPA: hypothetical protein VGY55_00550 [Pirellulales bacterium]|jgi:hypothetical protein|nr:hypothetical protein [Pirellulales bacterium]
MGDDIGPDEVDARLERISQYGQVSLSEPPLQANLRVANAELLELALRMKEELAAVLERRPDSIERLAHVRRGMNLYLRITSQISRYTQLVVKHHHGQTEN